MKPQVAIAMLDRKLAANGEMVSLRRGPKSAPVFGAAEIPAFVRGYKPSDLVAGSGISQRDSKVILSPTGSELWPDDFPADDDWCEIAGAYRAVVAFDHIRINGVVVRIELQVKG